MTLFVALLLLGRVFAAARTGFLGQALGVALSASLVALLVALLAVDLLLTASLLTLSLLTLSLLALVAGKLTLFVALLGLGGVLAAYAPALLATGSLVGLLSLLSLVTLVMWTHDNHFAVCDGPRTFESPAGCRRIMTRLSSEKSPDTVS